MTLIRLLFFLSILMGSFCFAGNTVSVGKVTINGLDVNSYHSTIKGSGVEGTEKRKLGPYTSINSQGGFDIRYSQAPYSVNISGDSHVISKVIAKVINNTLKIYLNGSYSSHLPIVITLSSPAINEITVNGTSNVVLNKLNLNKLKINTFGVVDLVADGNVAKLQLAINGTGDVNTKSLISDVVLVNLYGAANLVLMAKKELNASIYGVGSIIFFGDPEILMKQVFGVGNIEPGD